MKELICAKTLGRGVKELVCAKSLGRGVEELVCAKFLGRGVEELVYAKNKFPTVKQGRYIFLVRKCSIM